MPASNLITHDRELESKREASLLELCKLQGCLSLEPLVAVLSGTSFLTAPGGDPEAKARLHLPASQPSPAFCQGKGKILKCISGLPQFPNKGHYSMF